MSSTKDKDSGVSVDAATVPGQLVIRLGSGGHSSGRCGVGVWSRESSVKNERSLETWFLRVLDKSYNRLVSGRTESLRYSMQDSHPSGVETLRWSRRLGFRTLTGADSNLQ